VLPITGSPYVQGLRKLARENKLAITAGIHEPGHGSLGKIKNTSIWIDEEGEIVKRYQKLHLFDMNLTNGPKARESE
jgi:predicted amidohydrolase